MKWLIPILILGLCSAVVISSHFISTSATLASRFLKTLDSEKLQQASFNFDSPERKNWQYVPAARRGLTLKSMNLDQRRAARDLLDKSLSEAGLRTVETIRSLEHVLFEQENNNPGRDSEMYYFTVFGEPSDVDDWGWRFEGHHISLNFTFHDGKIASSSPQFLGANPAEVKTGPSKGLRALPKVQDIAFQLLDSLSPEQKKMAVSDSVSPSEIVTSNQRKVAILKDSGIQFQDLNSKQQAILKKLVEAHAEVQSTEERSTRLKRVDYKTVHFAWMGSDKPGNGHYYRIQGSKFLIEYDNTQNNANHIHTVWRDFDGDFGEDLLGDHYAHDHEHTHRE